VSLSRKRGGRTRTLLVRKGRKVNLHSDTDAGRALTQEHKLAAGVRRHGNDLLHAHFVLGELVRAPLLALICRVQNVVGWTFIIRGHQDGARVAKLP
jgi:hypothetical protein